VSEKPAPTPGVHPSWPADEAAALRAVLVECPPHIDLTTALWGASVALQRRRAAVVEQPEADEPNAFERQSRRFLCCTEPITGPHRDGCPRAKPEGGAS
jgi:hypothetical protein